jgi:hypothetical protein
MISVDICASQKKDLTQRIYKYNIILAGTLFTAMLVIMDYAFTGSGSSLY